MNKQVKIDGMMCKHCQKKVTDALVALGLDASVNLEEGIAYIKNSSVDNESITKAITDAGFEVTAIVNE